MSRLPAKIGARLTALTTRAEQTAQKNRAQRQRIVQTLDAMADHATGFAESVRAKAESGDLEAQQHYRRALTGRTRARRLVARERERPQ